MNDRIKAALIAGVILGGVVILITVVGTFARGVGCCNCLLPIGGGVLAVYLYTKDGRAPLPPGEGALLGLIAGAVAGGMYLIVGLPLAYFISAAALAAQFAQLRASGIQLPAGLSIGVLIVISGFVSVILYIVLGAIGGLLGSAIFGKGQGGGGPLPPPPPGSYGGPQPPTSYGGPQPPVYGGPAR